MQDVTEQRLTERELHAHYAVSQALREWESFELGVVDLLRRIATALDYPMGALWLWDASAEALGCRAFWTAPDVDPGDFERIIRGSLPRRARAGRGSPGRPASRWSRPTSPTDPDFALREAALERGMTSAIAFPAVGPDGPVAVLSFCSLRAPRAEPRARAHADGDRARAGALPEPAPGGAGPAPLSEREIEVLRLAAGGLSGPGIAEQLVLSPATVKTHFEHIYEKLGVGDRPPRSRTRSEPA